MKAMPREPQQQQGAHREARAANPQDALPRKAIGCMACNEEQKNAGKELRQAHQSEVQGTMRQRVDLPRHSHRVHLGRRRGEDARGEIVAEVGMAESALH
jgi:hypothetical protein